MENCTAWFELDFWKSPNGITSDHQLRSTDQSTMDSDLTNTQNPRIKFVTILAGDRHNKWMIIERHLKLFYVDWSVKNRRRDDEDSVVASFLWWTHILNYLNSQLLLLITVCTAKAHWMWDHYRARFFVARISSDHFLHLRRRLWCFLLCLASPRLNPRVSLHGHLIRSK